MIYRLRGILVEKDTEGVVVDVGGVGYRASASLSTLRALPSLGEECVIHTRMVVREDAMLLFGFAGREERSAVGALTAGRHVAAHLGPRGRGARARARSRRSASSGRSSRSRSCPP